MISRQVRELQTHVPFLPALKFTTYNFVSERFGWRIDRDFRLLERLAPFRLALDIGANRGQSVIALRRTAAPARIVCFEPNALLAGEIERRFGRSGDVEVNSCALGEEPGGFTLHVPYYRSYQFDGLASLDRAEALGFFNAKRMARFDEAKLSTRAIDVPVRRLDEFALAPDVVKIDVQGLELAVVKGGIETFRQNRPVTIVENPPRDLVALMREIGLSPYFFDGERLHRYAWQWKNAIFLTPEQVGRSGFAAPAH